MLNKQLTAAAIRAAGDGTAGKMVQFIVAGFIMAVGLCIAGAGTHLYQAFAKEQAMLRYDGKTYLRSMGHVGMSFVCGPYIMLQLGWRHEAGGTISVTSALIAALVAFGWAFITGLLFMGLYFAVIT
jgi:hypothetical protein